MASKSKSKGKKRRKNRWPSGKYGFGATFGELTIIDKAPPRGSNQYRVCRCGCGRTSVVHTGNLCSGKTTKCIECGRASAAAIRADKTKDSLLKRELPNGFVVGFMPVRGKDRPVIECATCGGRRVLVNIHKKNLTGRCVHCAKSKHGSVRMVDGKNMSQWAREFGISRQAMFNRIQRVGFKAAVARGATCAGQDNEAATPKERESANV